MIEISFTVLGEPKGQKRHRTTTIQGKARQYDPDKKSKQDLLRMVQEHAPTSPIDAPVRLDVIAYFGRPKSHYRTGKNSHILKENAPEWHTSRPDVDNISKRIMDALNKVFWRDDSVVCCGETIKMYTNTTPRIEVHIRTL